MKNGVIIGIFLFSSILLAGDFDKHSAGSFSGIYEQLKKSTHPWASSFRGLSDKVEAHDAGNKFDGSSFVGKVMNFSSPFSTAHLAVAYETRQSVMGNPVALTEDQLQLLLNDREQLINALSKAIEPLPSRDTNPEKLQMMDIVVWRLFKKGKDGKWCSSKGESAFYLGQAANEKDIVVGECKCFDHKSFKGTSIRETSFHRSNSQKGEVWKTLVFRMKDPIK